MKKLLARIITEDLGLLSREVTGIEQSVQAAQVDLWEAGQEPEHHLMVFAHYPEVARHLCEEMGTHLDKHFGDIIISFVVKDEPGKAVVFIPPNQQNRSSLLSKAAVIAVVKRSWGWEESEQIRVRCETTSETAGIENPRYESGRFEIEV